MRPSLAVVAAAATLFLLVGCQPAPTSPPSRVPVATGPTPACTPSPGAAATPCSADEFAAQQKQDALYVEAERVYRAFLTEDEAIARTGSLATPQFYALAAGPFAEGYAATYESYHNQGAKMVGGSYAVSFVRPAPNHSYPGTTVALESCVDATSVRTYVGTRNLGNGRIVHSFTYFKVSDGRLKLWHQEGAAGGKC
jgi:hypothetical protein